MKKLTAGRSKTQLRIHSITVGDGRGKFLHNKFPFWLDVEFYYEPELRFTEDEPGCPEYVEIISLKMFEFTKFVGDSTSMIFFGGNSFMSYITSTQYDDLVTMLIMQSKGDCYGT